MEKIKIKTIITNSDNETTNVEASAKYDEENGIITYSEEDLEVTITITGDCVKINRKNEDYDLNLEFKENEKIYCNHKILSMGINVEVIVSTLKLEIKNNYIYIQYKLNNLELDMGTFEYKLMFLN